MNAKIVDYKSFLVSDRINIKEAMKKLDESDKRILFIVDKHNKLLGALTDGDIRRFILAEGSLDEKIDKVYNPKPKYLAKQYDIQDVKKTMLENYIECLPIVDENKKVTSLLFWDDLFSDSIPHQYGKIDLPVVIMAGGKGARMEPFTKVLPKPLIPIGDKTIMEIIIEEFKKFGVRNFYMTLNYKGEMIEAYFNSLKKDYNLFSVWEKEFYGTAGSLKLINLNSDFIVSNCDIIVKADYSEVVKFHKENNSYLTMISSVQNHTIPYGVINFKEKGEVVELKEKPEYTFTVNTGIYILKKESLKFIPDKKVFDMTSLIKALLKSKKKIYTYPVKENDYIDFGQWKEYKKALQILDIG